MLGRTWRLAALVGLLGLGSQAWSADEQDDAEAGETTAKTPAVTLRDVEVTAQKRPEKAQDTPLSVVVLSRQDLEDAGAETVSDVLALAPNFSTVELGLRRTFLPYSRGVGAGQGAPAITTYIDGVPQLFQDTGNIFLHDVERIELVRGPQSVLYGRNALGGAINVVTRKPSNDWEGAASLSTGTDRLLILELSERGPLIQDELFLGLSLGYDTRRGYLYNQYDGEDASDRNGIHGSVVLEWLPDPDWRVKLAIRGERDRDGGYTMTPLTLAESNPHTVNVDDPGYGHRDFLQGSLAIDGEWDGLRLRSVTGLGYSLIDESLDTDFSPAQIIWGAARNDIWSVNQTLEIGSAADSPVQLADGLSLEWLLGASLSYSHLDTLDTTELFPLAVVLNISPVPGVFYSAAEVDTLSLGLYGQTTLHMGERWHLTLGLRGDYEEAETDIVRYSEPAYGPPTYESYSGDWASLLPQLILAYDLREHIMLYGSLSRGYRPGGFNLTSAIGNAVYDEETLWSAELGAKTEWLDDRLFLNVAVFATEWDDMQQQLIDPITQRPFVSNAAEASSYGFEVELRAKPASHTLVTAGFGYTHMRYDEFDSPFNGDASGNRILLVPDFTWMAALQQGVPLSGDLELYGRVELNGVGERYFDPGEVEGEDAYVIGHLTLGLKSKRWHAEVWARNVTDEDYVVTAFQHSLAPYVGSNGPPRTLGLTLGMTW